MKDEELRKQINSLIRGEIQDVINDYVEDKESQVFSMEQSGLGFVEKEDENELTVNISNQEVVTTELKEFDSYTTYNFSTSLGTTIYGMFDFGEDKKIQAIRHVIRPSVSYNINPEFKQYYDTYEVVSADGITSEEVEYTRFEQSLYGAPGNRFSSNIGLSLSNNIEAKIRDKDSTATEPKKIFLLNSLNFSTNYNIAADSLNWSPLRMTGGTQIFDNKMSVNFGATLDPYALNNNNQKINCRKHHNRPFLFINTFRSYKNKI